MANFLFIQSVFCQNLLLVGHSIRSHKISKSRRKHHDLTQSGANLRVEKEWQGSEEERVREDFPADSAALSPLSRENKIAPISREEEKGLSPVTVIARNTHAFSDSAVISAIFAFSPRSGDLSLAHFDGFRNCTETWTQSGESHGVSLINATYWTNLIFPFACRGSCYSLKWVGFWLVFIIGEYLGQAAFSKWQSMGGVRIFSWLNRR